MKYKITSVAFLVLTSGLFLSSCGEEFTNPGDYLGGGGEVSDAPEESTGSSNSELDEIIGDNLTGSETPSDSINIIESYTITEPGSYLLQGNIEGKISVESEDVTLFLNNANLENKKKVIESIYDLTLTLIGENFISNSNEEGSNAIDCEGNLLINGSGNLSITSTKNGIKANSIVVSDASLTINSSKDGLHAEVDAYDELEEISPSYEDGGYIYLTNAKVDVTSVDDGLQADTFIYIKDNSEINVVSGGGAPSSITETSSDNASGKGIKVGAIDYGSSSLDYEWDKYLLTIDNSIININSNDDALHSNGQFVLNSGTLNLTSGDDAIHSDDLLKIYDGDITINNCYEGIESAKVEISGGNIDIKSSEDGINAADGTTAIPGQANSNCHVIISGGKINVDCIGNEGDGIDSNGSMLISGGEIYVASSKNNSDSALDSDGGILVNGGKLVAVGALGMVETPAKNSGQCVISFAKNTAISSGTIIYLVDSENNILLSYTLPRNAQSIILSSEELKIGENYKIFGGDTELASFKIESTITTVGSSNDIPNPGGRPGR